MTALVLPYPPVSDELVSVTPSGETTALTLADLSVDVATGIVRRADGSWFGTGDHVIVYEAGYETLPADLALAVKELARHLWTTQRGPTGRPGAPAADPTPGAAYLLPYRVQQLLSAYELPGIA